MSRLAPLLTASLLLATAAPALADDYPPVVRTPIPPLESLRNPALAATLSALGMPAALAVMTPAILWAGGGFNASPLSTGLTILAPLGLGLGQAYAGHPQRGLAVGLGGAGILAAGYGLNALGAPSPGNAGLGGMALTASYVALVGYGAWATYDAYRLVDRENEVLRATPIDY
jgi:hypothetical protein